MQKVCQAVLYAHLRAVIHRDLKPSNILVSADGQPHILDFGLAKALLEEDEALTISVEGQIAGTPAYMSPEQAAGLHNQTDTRTDVFSLGVILYELLTGQSPHDQSGSMFDLLHEIAEGKIRRPREINKSIDSELEAILLKALARAPDDRYASAGALAKDITSYLDEEPLDAQVPTILYFLRKKARKYRVQVSAAAAVLALLFGTILIVYTRLVGDKAVREAQATELELKSQELTWAELELKALSGDREEARAALGVLRDEYVSAQDEISNLNFRLGQRKPPVATRRVDLAPGPALVSAALVREPSLPRGIESWTLETCGHRGQIAKLVYSPDGSWLASAAHDGTIRLWDPLSGQLSQVLVDPNAPVLDLTWSQDVTSLRGSNPGDGAWQFTWDIEAGRIERPDQAPSEGDWHNASRASWSADEPLLARTIDEVAGLLDIDLPPGLRTVRRPITALALCPERNRLAVGDYDGTIRFLDAKSGQLQHIRTAAWCGPVQALCFSPDGKVLATCAGLGTVCLWDTHCWESLRKFEAGGITGGSASIASSIAWAPDGTAIARANSNQRVVEVLDSQSGELAHTLSVGAHDIAMVSWSPDGTFVVVATEGGPVHLWDVQSDSDEPLATLPAHSGNVNALAWEPEGQSLITTGDDGKIEVWEPRSGTRIRSIEGYPAPINCLAFSPEGNVLAAGSENGMIRLWDTGGGWTSRLLRNEPNDTQAEQSGFAAVCWSPDGTELASADSAGNIRIWDPKSRQAVRLLAANCESISSLAWSPDGRVLLCGGTDGTVRIWDTRDDFQEHVVLLPLWGSLGPGIAINANGDYRGPPGIEEHLIYAARTADAQLTVSPANFRSQYGWVNEPWQVGLYEPGSEKVERLYVNAASERPHDGKTWATAFSDLQNALSIAQPDTEIWVAAGTYTPDRGTGARTASFHLKSGVRLLGGFDGAETSSYQRDPYNNETILSGDLKGNDGPNFVKNDENSYHVVTAHETYPNAVLDGFVITGGNANGPAEFQYHDGGGIHSTANKLTLINCTFRSNSADGHGGGMYHNSGRSDLSLTSCAFSNNRTTNLPHTHGWGGGIVISGATGRMVNCTLEGNLANDGGGAFLSGTSGFVLQNCTFIGNQALGMGGGIRGYGVSAYSLINCRFVGNSSHYGGGGVLNGGGCKATLVNCIFVGNSSRHGAGGMLNWPSKSDHAVARLTNCTFMANSSRVKTAGLANVGKCSSTLTNCILWSNTDRGDSLESAQIHGERTVIDHCCIQGWTGKLGGTGNFADNPLFVDPNGPDSQIGTVDDGLRLSPGSPCINAGGNSAIPADTFDLDTDGDTEERIPFDIDGKPRILNGTVDIGAHESD
ncbi:MAG: WD40 domain-containing protein [Planctomycetota bacterium]|jgi:WD40 repeat protein